MKVIILYFSAARHIEEADVLIIGGTSLAVYPAAGLIDYYRGNFFKIIDCRDSAGNNRYFGKYNGKKNEADFKESIGNRVAQKIRVEYVYQDLYNLPEGYEVPKGREKLWGTRPCGTLLFTGYRRSVCGD